MNPTYRRIVVPAIVLGIAALIVSLSAVANSEAALRFAVRGAYCAEPVWNTSSVIQDRMARTYVETDILITGLNPGDSFLTVSAPDYGSVTIPVTLKRGENRLSEPIAMMPSEIPGLDRFVVVERETAEGLQIDLRPIDRAGKAIVRHPCVFLRVLVQILIPEAGASRAAQNSSEPAFAEEVYRGPADVEWNDEPGATFRYSARIPAREISPHSSAVVTVQYLILMPDMEHFATDEIERIVHDVTEMEGHVEIARYLDSYGDALRHFSIRNENVRISAAGDEVHR